MSLSFYTDAPAFITSAAASLTFDNWWPVPTRTCDGSYFARYTKNNCGGIGTDSPSCSYSTDNSTITCCPPGAPEDCYSYTHPDDCTGSWASMSCAYGVPDAPVDTQYLITLGGGMEFTAENSPKDRVTTSVWCCKDDYTTRCGSQAPFGRFECKEFDDSPSAGWERILRITMTKGNGTEIATMTTTEGGGTEIATMPTTTSSEEKAAETGSGSGSSGEISAASTVVGTFETATATATATAVATSVGAGLPRWGVANAAVVLAVVVFAVVGM